jgi:DNA-binding SARP family transcriptional activator
MLDVDPFDEERYLHAARLLLQQGRRLRALAMLRRGADVLDRPGISPPETYAALEREIRARP